MSFPISPAAPPRHHADAVCSAPEIPQTLHIVAWTDPVIDTLGHDPRSWYVEQFWLGIIGPTTIEKQP
jgi:hypothetical protein